MEEVESLAILAQADNYDKSRTPRGSEPGLLGLHHCTVPPLPHPSFLQGSPEGTPK